MSKILIFGLPRTATTVFQQQVSQLFNVTNFSEPFYGDSNIKDWYTWSRRQQNGVMKVTTTNMQQETNFLNLNISDLFVHGKYTHLVVTKRRLLADCCASLFYAERVLKKYHFKEQESVKQTRFLVDEEFLNVWLIGVEIYYQTLNTLQKNSIRYEVLDYDLYIRSKSQKIFNQMIIPPENTEYVRKEIAYDQLCLNYQEITETIDNYVKKLR